MALDLTRKLYERHQAMICVTLNQIVCACLEHIQGKKVKMNILHEQVVLIYNQIKMNEIKTYMTVKPQKY